MFEHIKNIIPKAFINVENETESPIEHLLVKTLSYWGIKVKTQVKIGPYRVDILKDNVVIECDGKEFHQDAEKERKRDDYLRKKGYEVVHFSGSQIVRDSDKCVYDLLYHHLRHLQKGNKSFKRYYDRIEMMDELRVKPVVLDDLFMEEVGCYYDEHGNKIYS